MKNKKVEQGNTVKVFYKGYFDDKTVFDSNEGAEALSVQVGAGQVIKKFEEALLGMQEGEEKDISVEAMDGYGIAEEQLIQEIPKNKMPPNAPLQQGIMLTLVSPDGQRLFARIKEIKTDSVVLDLNHPLAGKHLNFHIKVQQIG